MLRWPDKAIEAVVRLFEPLQDVDVYVEDITDETFYSHLLRRLMEGHRRVVRVFAVGDRKAVLARAEAYIGSRPSVFLVDGDFEWVLGRPAPQVSRVLRLDAYCIENLLIDRQAAVRVLFEEACLSELAAESALDFAGWVEQLSTPLTRLFATFAAAHLLAPALPTISLGIGAICTAASRSLPELDPQKTEILRKKILNDVSMVRGDNEAEALADSISLKCDALEFPLDIVSGKDFLLPLLEFRLRKHGCRVPRRSLRLRLALHCNRSRFRKIIEALSNAV
jgi:hypothetical protein